MKAGLSRWEEAVLLLVPTGAVLWFDPGLFWSDAFFPPLWEWRAFVYPAVLASWVAWVGGVFLGWAGPFWKGAMLAWACGYAAAGVPSLGVALLFFPAGLGVAALAPWLAAAVFASRFRALPEGCAALGVAGAIVVLGLPAGMWYWCRADEAKAMAMVKAGEPGWRDARKLLARWRWLIGTDGIVIAYGHERDGEARSRLVQIFDAVDTDEIEISMSRLYGTQ